MISSGLAWAFAGASLALIVILVSLGVALVLYQRRFVAMHRNYADGLVLAQEQERASVAREVHDDALQRILLLIHELDGWTEQLNGSSAATTARLEAFRTELEDLSASLRQMAYRLHPSFHEQEGLVPLIQRLGAEIQPLGLQVEVREPPIAIPPLAAEQSLAIYRIVQEALTNVLRHSGSTWALVNIAARNGDIEVQVEDYGSGFDAARPPRRGLGLTSMSERARAAGGTVSIESHPGGGTRVQLRLPVHGKA